MKQKQNLLKLTTGLVFAATLFTSCDVYVKSDKATTEEIKPATIAEAREQGKEIVEVKLNQPAAELADAAEQLVGPFTFMLAKKVADLALEKDSTNLKAQFYSKLLARTEVFRGIQNRIRPLLKPDQIANWEHTKTEFPESPLKSFLYDETMAPITNVTEIQDVLGQYVTAIRDFRNFLKQNVASEMVINLNPHIFEDRIKKEAIKDCLVGESQNGDISLFCNKKSVAQIRMNTADFMALTQTESGELFYYGIYNSYSLEGIEKLNKESHPELITPKQTIDFLLANEKFGKLRKDNAINMIKEFGADLSSAIKWALQYQNQLCPNGYDSAAEQRRGYLFNKGVCFKNDNSAQYFMDLLDKAMLGAIPVVLNPTDGAPVSVNLDIYAWSKAPIKDLRSVAPTAYNSCGNITAIKDNTLGGVYVDNNFSQFINAECK